tara:strand:- start:365 stop:637 length:273 start_codon:yes stop_codon:yes gene_type:complete
MKSSSKIIQIQKKIITYLKTGNPLLQNKKKIPIDKSLLELGLIDSFGVIELVGFIEKNFKIQINDNELTKQKFGSILKMSKLISNKLRDS